MRKKFQLKDHFLLRLVILLCGLFCIALGVALSTKSGLGVSPSASLPYLLCRLLPLSMGSFTTLVNVFFVVLQIVLLRKNYRPVQLLQLAVVSLFGFFTDFTIALVAPIELSGYIPQLLLSLVSCAVMAFGLFLEVKAGLIVMASEGAISAISQVTGIEFGKVKIGLDCTFVVISTCLSLLCFHQLLGIREGTILAAILVGMFVQLYNRKLRFLDAVLAEPVSVKGQGSEKTHLPLVITIERELGSGGHEIGQRLAKELGIRFCDYALIEKTAQATGLTVEDIQAQEERLSGSLLASLYRTSYASSHTLSPQDTLFIAQSKVIEEYASQESCVIVGRLGSYVLRERENCFHIFLTASDHFRENRIAQGENLTPEAARQRRIREDAFRRKYCSHYTGEPWGLACHYALSLDTSVCGVDGAVKLIREALGRKGKMKEQGEL